MWVNLLSIAILKCSNYNHVECTGMASPYNLFIHICEGIVNGSLYLASVGCYCILLLNCTQSYINDRVYEITYQAPVFYYIHILTLSYYLDDCNV